MNLSLNASPKSGKYTRYADVTSVCMNFISMHLKIEMHAQYLLFPLGILQIA